MPGLESQCCALLLINCFPPPPFLGKKCGFRQVGEGHEGDEGGNKQTNPSLATFSDFSLKTGPGGNIVK